MKTAQIIDHAGVDKKEPLTSVALFVSVPAFVKVCSLLPWKSPSLVICPPAEFVTLPKSTTNAAAPNSIRPVLLSEPKFKNSLVAGGLNVYVPLVLKVPEFESPKESVIVPKLVRVAPASFWKFPVLVIVPPT